jgi:putrescine transport system permease protein
MSRPDAPPTPAPRLCPEWHERWGLRAWSAGLFGVPTLFLIVFLILPFWFVLQISLSELNESGVGFQDMVQMDGQSLHLKLRFASFTFLFGDALYLITFLSSLMYAVLTTGLCLLIGYPFAYAMACSPQKWQRSLLLLVMVPFWTSFLLRIYAWKSLLDSQGLINKGLLLWGWIDQPMVMLYTPFSLLVGMVYVYLPFMVLPLYAHFRTLDPRLQEAASDLGAKPLTAFFSVTLPLSRPGVWAGSVLVLVPCIGEYVIPSMLGGSGTLNIGRVLWDEFFNNNDWSMASAVALAMLALVLVPILWAYRLQDQAMRRPS